MSDRLFALRLFARVARKGSFSAASRELNILQSTASRTIAVLERQIGVVLFVRTTRAVTLTDTGSDFLARIEPLLAELDEAEHAAPRNGRARRGILRIGLGTNFAVREIIPRLAVFMSRHPALQIDLMMADQRQDLVAEGVDVAFRFGALSDFDSNGAESYLMAARPYRRASLPRRGRLPRYTCGFAPSCNHSRARQPRRALVLSQG